MTDRVDEPLMSPCVTARRDSGNDSDRVGACPDLSETRVQATRRFGGTRMRLTGCWAKTGTTMSPSLDPVLATFTETFTVRSPETATSCTAYVVYDRPAPKANSGS